MLRLHPLDATGRMVDEGAIMVSSMTHAVLVFQCHVVHGGPDGDLVQVESMLLVELGTTSITENLFASYLVHFYNDPYVKFNSCAFESRL